MTRSRYDTVLESHIVYQRYSINQETIRDFIIYENMFQTPSPIFCQLYLHYVHLQCHSEITKIGH